MSESECSYGINLHVMWFAGDGESRASFFKKKEKKKRKNKYLNNKILNKLYTKIWAS